MKFTPEKEHLKIDNFRCGAWKSRFVPILVNCINKCPLASALSAHPSNYTTHENLVSFISWIATSDTLKEMNTLFGRNPLF